MSEVLYAHSQRALATGVGDDFVALNVEQGQCYGMEKVTAEVWRLIGNPMSVADICSHLIGRYDVTPSACRAEVQELINKLLSEGLVEQVDAIIELQN